MNVFAKKNGVSFRDPASIHSVEESNAVAGEHSSTDTETEEEGKGGMEESIYSYGTSSILRNDFASQMTPVKREETTSPALSLQRCAVCADDPSILISSLFPLHHKHTNTR